MVGKMDTDRRNVENLISLITVMRLGRMFANHLKQARPVRTGRGQKNKNYTSLKIPVKAARFNMFLNISANFNYYSYI